MIHTSMTGMKKGLALLLGLSMAAAPSLSVFAEAETAVTEVVSAEAGASGAEAASAENGSAASSGNEEDGRKDNLSVTRHTTTIQGQEISYTATAGITAMDTDLGQYDLFSIAYTKDDVEDPADRPITFVWNGGPGAASLFTNVGFLGPDRLSVNEEGMVTQVPTVAETNDYSILDLTDLVFIDPVGTGFSRAAGDTDPAVFCNYYNDRKSVGDFIRVYVNRNGRWASPKYLAGESYGTTRCAAVCQYLQEEVHMNLNGIMMISSANSYVGIQPSPGNELPYVTFVPTFAATAWYHKRAASRYLDMELEAYLEEVRLFAEGEYQAALFKGSSLTPEETEDLAQKLADYIGLEKETILKNHLRIDMETFCAELLKDQNLVCGRTDSRYTGPAVGGDMGDGTSDPSSSGVVEAFTSCINDVISRKLDYQTDDLYLSLNLELDEATWFSDFRNTTLSQEKIIHDSMSKNPFMKIWVLCGYYDLATPFFSAEWFYNHLFLNEDYQKNLSFTYYPSGHMFYLHEPSLAQFRKDAEAWFGA